MKTASDMPCSVEGCAAPGEYKAPSSKNEEGGYRYMCLEHIRAFNRSWNYFDGWSREQIESFSHSLVHGHRPTWSMNSRMGIPHHARFTPEMLRDGFFRMMGEKPGEASAAKMVSRAEREALSLLDLAPGATLAEIKTQYKKLVKKHHPDVNKGDKASEEMLKRITAAYTLLSRMDEFSHEN